MKFFEDKTAQYNKQGHYVCGDYYLCIKSIEGTVYILCDGVGSGTYANIAAINCASRLREHLRGGVPMRNAASMVAAAMHRARTESFPFAAFSIASILNDGSFDIFSYEAPEALLVRSGFAHVLQPTFFAAGLEAVGETSGTLEIGDSLILCSDGITQAGMGHGRGFGIGSAGVASFVTRNLAEGKATFSLPEAIAAYCADLSAGRHEDDTTLALLHCRPAVEVSCFTGPPSSKAKDQECVREFMAHPGEKIVCGSTTIDILSRELNLPVRKVQPVVASFASPPEYEIEGISLTTEGAIMLNQVYNILGEEPEEAEEEEGEQEDGVVARFCNMLTSADVIHFFVGGAVNEAHQALIFKQMGIMPRHRVLDNIMKKLQGMGKLVTERSY